MAFFCLGDGHTKPKRETIMDKRETVSITLGEGDEYEYIVLSDKGEVNNNVHLRKYSKNQMVLSFPHRPDVPNAFLDNGRLYWIADESLNYEVLDVQRAELEAER